MLIRFNRFVLHQHRYLQLFDTCTAVAYDPFLSTYNTHRYYDFDIIWNYIKSMELFFDLLDFYCYVQQKTHFIQHLDYTKVLLMTIINATMLSKYMNSVVFYDVISPKIKSKNLSVKDKVANTNFYNVG